MSRGGVLGARPVLAVVSSATALALATAVCWAVEPPPIEPIPIRVSGADGSIAVQVDSRVGCHPVALALTDAAGAPAAGSRLEVQPIDPLMGMALQAATGATDRTGEALVNICFPMTGPWELHVLNGAADFVVPLTVTG